MAELSANPLEHKELDTRGRIFKQLDYASARFQGYENERDKLLKLALAVAGFGGLSISVLLSPWLDTRPFTRLALGLALIVAVLTAFVIISLFVYGTKLNYTHRKIADIRGWYYRYAIKKEFENDLIDGNSRSEERMRSNFAAFSKSMIDVMGSREMQIAEDLEQLYILYVFQAISSRNHRQMIDVLRWGVIASPLFVIIALVLALCGV